MSGPPSEAQILDLREVQAAIRQSEKGSDAEADEKDPTDEIIAISRELISKLARLSDLDVPEVNIIRTVNIFSTELPELLKGHKDILNNEIQIPSDVNNGDDTDLSKRIIEITNIHTKKMEDARRTKAPVANIVRIANSLLGEIEYLTLFQD
ncbi:hypothetical protein HN512_05175 [Candidatus Peregrinibacteria bacterium]|nr:hypothetical protein [Candidatus Peregrinibacteria bacterium]MBT3599198.1 hypothetical protein [Candidatus Peregrinibacteria bacterium]MBT7009096.1 hypothetical protein [Candidatus Peregrinibacteria bacterium]MBT7345316.1 hypothetical protein [Candidatus Peregrinibacteria bacterium]MBT7929165.1 hypothetical protein [Candidatus Peregrinibacteria bacterium]